MVKPTKYERQLHLLESKSFFLYGARATGKSFLLKEVFRDRTGLWVDLLNSADFLRYGKKPSLLYDECLELVKNPTKDSDYPIWVIIDEIQRVPLLLNEVHRLLEGDTTRDRLQFALTGSSARKLKRGGGNLLAGRALVNHIFPLTVFELGNDFNLTDVLSWGSLPSVATTSDSLVKYEILQAYAVTYLREEIMEEQIVRSLDPFTRFLETAAHASGTIVNYSAIGRDCQVESKTVGRYFQILEETLIGFFLPPFHNSIRKQQTQAPKFYFFDLGVQRILNGTLGNTVSPQSFGYGKLFEQFLILEVFRRNSYLRAHFKLSYLRTKDDAEIDLVVVRPGRKTVIMEIKSTTTANSSHAIHLRRFLPDFPNAEAWLVSQDEKVRTEDNVYYVNWKRAIEELFAGG